MTQTEEEVEVEDDDGIKRFITQSYQMYPFNLHLSLTHSLFLLLFLLLFFYF